jgi:hypothetical protein
VLNAAASASGKPRSSTPPLSAIFASMRSCTCVSKFPGVREIEKARTRGHAILAATEEHALNKRSHLPDWQRPISWPPRDSCSLPATGARKGNGGHQIRAEKAARAGSRWQPLLRTKAQLGLSAMGSIKAKSSATVSRVSRYTSRGIGEKTIQRNGKA